MRTVKNEQPIVIQEWYVLAAANGDSKAKRNASPLELMLSPEENETGKRRAQAWLEQRKITAHQSPARETPTDTTP